MSVGVWLALVACAAALVGLGLVALLLVKLDARSALRRIKVDAHVGRWFGLAVQIDRETAPTPPAVTSDEAPARKRTVGS